MTASETPTTTSQLYGKLVSLFGGDEDDGPNVEPEVDDTWYPPVMPNGSDSDPFVVPEAFYPSSLLW